MNKLNCDLLVVLFQGALENGSYSFDLNSKFLESNYLESKGLMIKRPNVQKA